MARAADVVKRSFEYRGEPGRAFAELLALALDAPARVAFELSQADEHRALPDRDAALRDPDGFLSSELGWRVSTTIRMVATWRDAVLRLDGYVADLDTAHPRMAGPRFRFVSPMVDDATQLPGWRALIASVGEAGVREVELGSGERAIASVLRVATYDARSRAVDKLCASVAFGPARAR